MDVKSLSAGISIREFARLDGCDERLVRRAIKGGSLAIGRDKTIDPALVSTGWRKTNRRRPQGADTADKSANICEMSARASDRDLVAVLDPSVAAQLAAGTMDLATADKVKANALALKHLLAARKAAGDLVEMQLAESVLFEEARAVRDAWANWPTRVGPLIAADLGLTPEAVVEVLTGHVHRQLVELGEPDGDFGDDRGKDHAGR